MIRKFFFLLAFCCACQAQAQLHFSADVKNNHLWRGIEVADGLVLTADVNCTLLDGLVNFGLWGGTNTTGTYKEFNNHLSFRYRGLSLSFWDIYNFSPGATYNNRQFFNYRARETGRFLDAIVDYRFDAKFPLLLSWSTVIFGRDRNAQNTENKYSTFCYAEYPIYQKESWQVDMGIGGAFALNRSGDSSHFYGNKAGIVHVMLKVTHRINIGKWEMPLYACAMWNPQGDRAFLQIGAQVFSF
ncbi:hypothetical protein [Bacteroides pyogenes]|uniref:hypothetical protein n=1 Tax=Bacteroides pyogenes TaxID=310300 RepID=UPI001FD056B5|nr:hypothetical protein [Bacteroides pyogenes]